MMMFNIHATYDPKDIKEQLGWADHPTISDVVEGIMVLCDVVQRQERKIAELEAHWAPEQTVRNGGQV